MNLKSIFQKSWLPARLRRKKVVESKKVESIDLTSIEKIPKYVVDKDPVMENIIFQKRNKSRLSPNHRNVLFGQRPYNESMAFYHDTLLYKRRMLGRYGIEAAGVPVGIAWPTEEELADMKEQERVAYPKSIQQLWEEIRQKRIEETAEAIAREKDVCKKMETMQEWIAKVQQKKAGKEAELLAAKARKEKMMEEIRQEFGFSMTFKDPRLKELMEQKEIELKKQRKKAKKQQKEEQMLQKALESAQMLQSTTSKE